MNSDKPRISIYTGPRIAGLLASEKPMKFEHANPFTAQSLVPWGLCKNPSRRVKNELHSHPASRDRGVKQTNHRRVRGARIMMYGNQFSLWESRIKLKGLRGIYWDIYLGAVDPPAKSYTFCWLKGHMGGLKIQPNGSRVYTLVVLFSFFLPWVQVALPWGMLDSPWSCGLPAL